MAILLGQPAPAFTLFDQDGVARSLKDFIGFWVLVYFYPKDNTPGCTSEACSLRDSLPNFSSVKAVVLGISADTVESHKKFSEKYTLPFRLLADPTHNVIESYGFWQEKKFLGRAYFGTVRSSVLVRPDGTVAKVYEQVKPAAHAAIVLQDLAMLQATEQ